MVIAITIWVQDQEDIDLDIWHLTKHPQQPIKIANVSNARILNRNEMEILLKEVKFKAPFMNTAIR